MRLLLDTPTFLWFIGGEAALSPYARQLIEDRTNERLLSIASLWEMAIKVSLGRLTVPLPFTALVAEHVYGNAIELFDILPRHLDVLTTLRCCRTAMRESRDFLEFCLRGDDAVV